MKHRSNRSVAALLLSLLLFLSPYLMAAETITVDPGTTYQTIKGWEATPRSWEIDKTNNRYDPTYAQHKLAVLDTLVNTLGVNRIRLELQSGFENTTDYWTPFANGQISYSEYGSHMYEVTNDNSNPNNMNPNGFQWAALDWKVDNVIKPMQQLLAAKGEKVWVNLCFVDFNSNGGFHANNPDEYAELFSAAF